MVLLNKVISRYCSTNVAWHYSARTSPGTVRQKSHGITQQGHLQVLFMVLLNKDGTNRCVNIHKHTRPCLGAYSSINAASHYCTWMGKMDM